MIHIAIVEDEKAMQEELFTYIKQFENITGERCKITFFNDGLEMIEGYESIWDLIFMDIQMEQMDGLSTAKRIRKLDDEAVIVFITMMGNLAIKGYEVNAFDFLEKPINYQLFHKKMEKAIRKVKSKKQTKYIILPSGKLKKKVATDEILYMEVNVHTIKVVTRNEVFEARYALKKIEEELKEYHFVRCNHSFLVNLDYVTAIEKDEVCLGKVKIPVSRMKKKEFLEAFSNYTLGGK